MYSPSHTVKRGAINEETGYYCECKRVIVWSPIIYFILGKFQPTVLVAYGRAMVPIWKGLIRMTITACKKGQQCFEWFILTCKICWGQCIREHPWESPDQRIDSHFEIFVVRMEVKEETNTSILILNWMAWESLDGKHGKIFYTMKMRLSRIDVWSLPCRGWSQGPCPSLSPWPGPSSCTLLSPSREI